jgi:hypothetical protein
VKIDVDGNDSERVNITYNGNSSKRKTINGFQMDRFNRIIQVHTHCIALKSTLVK